MPAKKTKRKREGRKLAELTAVVRWMMGGPMPEGYSLKKLKQPKPRRPKPLEV